MKIYSLIIIFFLCIATTDQAQALKFGHINSADLLQAMPEVKSADSVLQAYQKALQDQNDAMLAEYDKKVSDYQKGTANGTITDATKDVIEEDIKSLADRIQQFQSSAQDKLANKKEEVYGPILKKAEDAIKQVAKDNNYSYVFDDSAGGVIYAQPSDDIMPLVKKKLGVQ